jgi:hypothetical protein
MFHRFTLGLAVRVTVVLARPLRRMRRRPDAGMETADKILWAAAVTIVASAVGAIFRDKLEAFANALSVDLGW